MGHPALTVSAFSFSIQCATGDGFSTPPQPRLRHRLLRRKYSITRWWMKAVCKITLANADYPATVSLVVHIEQPDRRSTNRR
jgi:hypothetical protein